MFGDILYEDWTLALDSTAEELLWEAGLSEPPVDAFLIALRLGVLVTEDFALPARAQFVRLAGDARSNQQEAATLSRCHGYSTPTIVLGQEQRFERRQFAVAHELGEFAAERVFDRLGISPRHVPLGSREQIANSLAGRMLLPQRWLAKFGIECEWDLQLLKETFWTASYELLARRMLDMSPRIVLTVFDLGKISWRQGNFNTAIAPPTATEIDCWRECHESGCPVVATSSEMGGAATVRCWPVHEPEWKREIMRVDLLGGEDF